LGRDRIGSLTSLMTQSNYSEILERIESALEASRKIFERFTPGEIAAEYKAGLDPVTEADLAVNALLHKELLRGDEGWLSEESVDDPSRLQKKNVWIVDPLDGTREFVAGIPEFCISIAYAVDGRSVAGGICNPATNEVFLGAIGSGITYNGKPAKTSSQAKLDGATVLASRSESKRGEWKRFESANFKIREMGSVAYKLALVAAGLADATFTLVPKHEWDIAAGAALVESAGGFVRTPDNQPLRCNMKSPLLAGLVAGGPNLQTDLMDLIQAS
jgi:myo-inositol-1(or 4)-monophosphatase